MGFPKQEQEYWSWSPFSPPGDLPDPGIEPGSPALQADFLPPVKPCMCVCVCIYIYVCVCVCVPAPTCQLSHMKVLVLNTLCNAFDKFRK